MSSQSPGFSIGIEEEYLLVDPETRSLATRQPPDFMARCKEILGGRVTHEFLQSQVEIGTGVCATVGEARAELRELRAGRGRDRARIRHADDRRLDPPLGALARAGAGGHGPLPHARGRASEPRPAHGDLRHACPRRHRGPDLRVDLMSQVSYFMPHLLALSSLLAVLGGARHRAQGLPADHHRRPAALGPAGDLRELERLAGDAQVLAETGMVTDPSKIWWDMRPSGKHPTLEIRICDICTWSEDGLTIAALYQSILAMLYAPEGQQPALAALPPHPDPREQVARPALRRRGGARPTSASASSCRSPTSSTSWSSCCARTPRSSTCVAEIEHARVMARRGTSADHQLRVYHAALDGRRHRARGPGRGRRLAGRAVGSAGQPARRPS